MSHTHTTKIVIVFWFCIWFEWNLKPSLKGTYKTARNTQHKQVPKLSKAYVLNLVPPCMLKWSFALKNVWTQSQWCSCWRLFCVLKSLSKGQRISVWKQESLLTYWPVELCMQSPRLWPLSRCMQISLSLSLRTNTPEAATSISKQPSVSKIAKHTSSEIYLLAL